MNRRKLLTVLAGASALRPHFCRAEMPTVGFLSGAGAEAWAAYAAAFRKGLAEAGFDEGRNVAIEYRWADGRYDRLPALAAELVARRVSVIAAATAAAALAAKRATAAIPIVFMTINDPVALGLVRSLGRPGANITGVTHLSLEMEPKLLEMLHQAVPDAAVMALLVNPTGPNAKVQSSEIEAAAQTMGIRVHVLSASTASDLDAAFAKFAELRVRGLVIGGDPFFGSARRRLAELALRDGLPSIYQARMYPTVGGLMSYGGDALADYRLAGTYAGRILKGERPADLPVQQTTKIELVINLKTAKALDLAVPQSILARADEVIE